MFDEVPVRAWLMIFLAAVAYPQAHYLVRHIANSPSRHDITQAQADLSWRTLAQFIRSFLILGLLAALAIFIFTPAAEEFASSPRFWPIPLAGIGMWALYTVVLGLVSGRIEPFIKGLNDTFERVRHPTWYWASLAWNGALGIFVLWAAYQTNEAASAEADWELCFEGPPGAPGESHSACNGLLARYGEEIRRSSDDYAPRYNRGLVHQQLGDAAKAMEDFSAAIRLQPTDPDAYLRRGLILLDSRRFDQAIGDFSKAHELDPKDPWSLANRGLAYAWKQDQDLATRDFAAASAIDPANVVVMRGRALLSMQDADLAGAIAHLSASLQEEPDNAWALRMRAWNYRQAGQPEKARADENRLNQLVQ